MRATAASPQANPFPGLRPFREDEEHLFFGRENQIDAMVNKLAATRFLAVVGTSGSGKSSLVNCGLRPALRQGLMAPAGTAWRMAQFRPGNDPIGAMARALAQDGVLFREQAAAGMTLADIIETTLRMSKLGLIDIREQAALDPGVNLLLVVDQFEELFRYRQVGNPGNRDAEKIADAAAFVNLLLEVRERADLRIFVVLTMRSDFLGDCTQFPGLAEAINAGQYLVPRMTRDERRAAIEGPIQVGGAQAAPVLLTRLVNDVGDNPDQLSILQHALNRTWACWQAQGGKGPLELSHYEAIGTMTGALDKHADKAYAELGSARQQQICERLFKALTDKANDPRGVRRPTTLDTLCALTDATPAEVADVIDVFRKPSRSFLMPPAGDALEPGTVIDISHESLMRVWERLITWAEEEAQSARAYCRLAEASDLYAEGKVNLWRDPELQLALDWRDKSQPNETWASRYHSGFADAIRFLTASSEARDAERAERQSLRQRERDAEREKLEAQERNARRLFRAALATAAVALIAIIFGVFAVYYFVEANEASLTAAANEARAKEYLARAQITESRSLVKTAEQTSGDQSMEVLLALEALPDSRERVDRPFVFGAHKILAKGIDNLLELAVIGGHTGALLAVAVMPDGRHILTGSDDNVVRMWDVGSGAEVRQFRGHNGKVLAVAVTPDGRHIVTGSDDNTARVWDAGTGDERRQIKGTHAVQSVAVTPDGARIITGSDDNIARVWDVGSGAEQLQLKGHAGSILAVAVMPDGRHIVTGSGDNTARVWDASTGDERLQLKGSHAVRSVAVMPDGARIITGSDDNIARVWDASSGAKLLQLQGHARPVTAVTAMPGGSFIVTGSEDGTARIWSATTGAELRRLDGHTLSVSGVVVTPDNARIITASRDNTARVWDTRTGTAMLWLEGHSGNILAVTVTPDGARIVTGAAPSQADAEAGAADATSRVWDASTGKEQLRLKGTRTVRSVAVTPDGARIITGSHDNIVRVWDAGTGEERLQLKGPRAMRGVAVTPDGTRFITSSDDNIVRVWDASSGAELRQFKNHRRPVQSIAVTPDGNRVVTGSLDATARVWDIGTGDETLRLNAGPGSVNAVAVAPDGVRIITGSSNGTVLVWDLRTGAEPLQLKGHTRGVRSVAVTPDGTRIATGSDDGTLRIWDASTGLELLQKSHPKPVLSVAVTPDGGRVITASDNSVSVWALAQLRPPPRPMEYSTVARQVLVDQAKGMVSRCLTIQQRSNLLLGPRPPGWCIDLNKYPYDTPYWKAWRAGNTAAAIDADTAASYGNFADAALKAGDYRSALEAAELGLAFDSTQIWITINKAHAYMFLGEKDKAIGQYAAHRGKKIEQGPWEEAVIGDFQLLREQGHDHPLMVKVEEMLRPAPAPEAPK